MIISSDQRRLSEIMRDFKKYTSKRIIEELKVINESRKEWLLRVFTNVGKDLKRISGFKVGKMVTIPSNWKQTILRTRSWITSTKILLMMELLRNPNTIYTVQPGIIVDIQDY